MKSLLPIPRDPELIEKEIAAYYGMISEVDSRLDESSTPWNSRACSRTPSSSSRVTTAWRWARTDCLGKQNLYEESMRIPMIFVGPGIAANVVSEQFAQLPDIMPTVAALLGIDPPASSEGSALLGANAGAFSRPTAYFQYRICTGDSHGGPLEAHRLSLDRSGPAVRSRPAVRSERRPKELNDLSAVDAYQTKLSALESLLASERARHDDALVK